MKMVRQKCDSKMVKESGHSRLSTDSANLAKPVQRALIDTGVLSARDLAQRTADQIAGLHGIGPSAMGCCARR
jgi:hypothetical protein